MYVLVRDHEISVEDTNVEHITTQEWKIKAVLVNLDTNQEVNANKVFDLDVHIEGNTFASYLKNVVYGSDSTLLLHGASLTNGAADNNYRYSGASASVNNWVCFGTDAENCPNSNLYRIIGVFDNQVKLIYYNSTLSGTGGQPEYSKSDRRPYLNNTYLPSLENWGNLIATTKWNFGKYSFGVVPKTMYVSEMNGSIDATEKIGLMYVYDYGFAASPSSWSTKLSNYNTVSENNWLFSNINEWTITGAIGGGGADIINVTNTGGVTQTYPYYGTVYNYRPVFYLLENVLRVSGTGTLSDPYRIA